MLRAVLLLAVPLLLAACTTARPIVLPDGSAGHAIRCDGLFVRAAGCIDKAGELCPNGYRVMTAGGERPVLTTAETAATRSLLVGCRTPAA